MFTAQELDEFRADARSRMGAENGSSTVRIRRRSKTETVVHPQSHLKVPAWTVVHQSLPFRLKSPGAGTQRRITVGDTSYDAATAIGVLEHNVIDLADGDLIEITAGLWVGSVYRVIETTKHDQATSRRFPVEEVARPTEWEAAA